MPVNLMPQSPDPYRDRIAELDRLIAKESRYGRPTRAVVRVRRCLLCHAPIRSLNRVAGQPGGKNAYCSEQCECEAAGRILAKMLSESGECR